MRTEDQLKKKETTSVEIDIFLFFRNCACAYIPEKNHIHGGELLGRVMG